MKILITNCGISSLKFRLKESSKLININRDELLSREEFAALDGKATPEGVII